MVTRPPLVRPVDFDEFWRRALTELDAVRPDVRRETVAAEDSVRLELVSFASLGGVRVHAWGLVGPQDPRRPLIVQAHGYGGVCEPRWDWARAGVDVFCVDVRGFGRSAAGVVAPSRWGWILTGATSPETHVLRGAVCDYLRAATVARSISPGAPRLVLHGMSLAGGLALMAEALGRAADLLVVGVPSLGWAEGRLFFARGGSAAQVSAYLARQPAYAAEDLMVVLRYFDPLNFVHLVRCPTLVGVGLADQVVPAATVLAIAERLAVPCEVMRFPVSHTGADDERVWRPFVDRLLDLALTGVPPGFGQAVADWSV
jgi:cephalosporin-C deacetylase